MQLPGWTSGKIYYLLATLTLALWWGSGSLPGYNTDATFASDSSMSARATTFIPTGECRFFGNHGGRLVPDKPADKFPLPVQSKLYGGLRVIFLGVSRKPRPDNIPDPIGITALFQVKDSDSISLPPIDQRRQIDHIRSYLRHCAFLI